MRTPDADGGRNQQQRVGRFDGLRSRSLPEPSVRRDASRICLATLGALFGMNPARLESCRVLELGCGEGANLIPVAFQWPESEFVGIDLSAEAIRYGNDFIGRLGLRNITLRCLDIMEIDREFGSFDYIIVHGVYSWVPASGAREGAIDLPAEPCAARHRLRQLQLLSGMPLARYCAPDHALPRARRDRSSNSAQSRVAP